MRIYSIILSVVLACTSFISAKPEKHLFLLSGQSNMRRMDPEISFIPAVAAEFGKKNVIIAKEAKGGQPIRRWYKKWEPLESDRSDEIGDLYAELMKKTKAATKNQKFATVTLVWMQGESDANKNNVGLYEESFNGLMTQIKEDLGIEELNFVIGRLSDCKMDIPEWIQMRELQMRMADESENGGWVNTDDLNTGKDHKGNDIVDDIHYSVTGYKTLGKRFAEKAIELINNKGEKKEKKKSEAKDPE